MKGVAYGIPHGWGANLLMWNPKVVTTAPDSWGAVFGKTSPYKGKLTAYDSPIYIADAALYLMKTQPSLGIKNPYALNQTQFDAAIALLKTQKANVGEYWSDYLKAADAFEKGSLVMGTTWQVIANTINGTKAGSVQTVLPKEGSTAWSDTWMVSSKAKHPNCMYKWMNYITSPSVQAQVAQYFGEAPANPKACTIAAAGVLLAVPRHRRRVRRQALLLDHAHQGVPRRQRQDGLPELPAVDERVERPARLVIV